MHVFRFYLWGTPGTICVPWPRTGSCRREFVPLDRSSRTVSGSSHSDRSKTLPITPRGLRASSTSAPPPTIPTAGGRPGMSLEASLGPPPACQRLHRATRIVSPTGGRGDPSVPAGPMFGDRLTIPSHGYGGLRPDPPSRRRRPPPPGWLRRRAWRRAAPAARPPRRPPAGARSARRVAWRGSGPPG